jgi:uncharacterized protein involved in type VI secretion and phage assembly
MTTTQLQISPVVKIDGAAMPDAVANALVSIDVDRGFNIVGRATLRFIETGFDLVAEPKFQLGTKVTIAGPNNKSLFAGEVTGVSLDQASHDGAAVTELIVSVDDASHKLALKTQNQAYLNQGYADVIGTMVAGTGLSAAVTGLTDPHPYLLQTSTNLAYLDWIAARCGLVWWVDGTTLNVKKAGTTDGSVTLTLGKDLLRVSTRASGLHAGKFTVTGWDPAQQEAVQDYADTKKSPESGVASGYPGRVTPTGTGITVTGASPLTKDEATQLSTALLAESTAAVVTTRGTTYVNADLKLGATVTVASAGRTSGSYLVTQVRHTYDTTGFYTHFTAGPIRPGGLVDLLGAPPAPNGSVISGLLVGTVSDIGDPNNLGRVKVAFPTLGSSVDSEWARVLSVGGGIERGIVFQPEVKDEVLVGFEQGDTRRPVVIGGLFSAKNTLPDPDNIKDKKSVEFRRIKSRLGHVIELADGDGPEAQHVMLKTKKGAKIRVGEDKIELVIADKPVSISNGTAKIEFSDSGDVTIEGANITLKTKGNVKIEGTGGVEAKSTGTTKLEGAILDLKGSGTGTVDGGGTLTLKGGMVMIN